ncbi:hypothetical protein PESP_b0141 [Pseudoalteromonas espejiana DSM 9414]|nr:hypothetical protein PESP_b0141 [Pseudoalteromonas espejiana DSM 9414]
MLAREAKLLIPLNIHKIYGLTPIAPTSCAPTTQTQEAMLLNTIIKNKKGAVSAPFTV